MKNRKQLIGLCLLILTCVFVGVSLLSAGPPAVRNELPRPLLPLSEVGEDYKPELERMRSSIANGKRAEFYNAVSVFNLKLKANREIRAIEKTTEYLRSDAIAVEWKSYYVACAPPLVAEEYLEFRDEELLLDFAHKEWTLFSLLSITENEAKLMKCNWSALQNLHLIWEQALVKSSIEASMEAYKSEREFFIIFKKERKPTGMTDEGEEERIRKYHKLWYNWEQSNKRTQDIARAINKSIGPEFLKYLRNLSPKLDAYKMKKILENSGFASKEYQYILNDRWHFDLKFSAELEKIFPELKIKKPKKR